MNTRQKIVVLIVDDQLMVAEGIRRMLADESDIELHYCDNPNLAVDVAENVGASVLLLDTVMPSCNSYDIIKYFREHQVLHNIVIVVLSSKIDPYAIKESLEQGANDYLVKLPDKIELIARIRAHYRTYLLLQKYHVNH